MTANTTTATTGDAAVRVRLARSAHLVPEDGMCLMEAVSRAARLPWGDEPACTHRLLAHLARLVNDAMSDTGRQQLADLIGPLTCAASGDGSATARASAGLAATCTEFALALRPDLFHALLLAHLHRVAVAELRREQATDRARHRLLVQRARRWLFAHGPGARAIEAAVQASGRLPTADRDPTLLALLRTALETRLDAGRSAARGPLQGELRPLTR
jgi:hypothetical protein